MNLLTVSPHPLTVYVIFSLFIPLASQHNVPHSPTLEIVSTSWTWIQVKWTPGWAGRDPIKGYNLFYNRKEGWIDKPFDQDTTMYTLDDLNCGEEVSMYIRAFNGYGTGAPSTVLTIFTKIEDIRIPSAGQFISPDIDYVLLFLDKWDAFGCPVLGFQLKYKEADDAKDWLNVVTDNSKIKLKYLKPATKYSVEATIYTSGVNKTETFEFSTLTKNGDAPIPSADRLIASSSNSLVIDVNEWQTMGCKIDTFQISYKQLGKLGSPNKIVNITTNSGLFEMKNLSPFTLYLVQLTAFGCGDLFSRYQEFEVATLPYESTEESRKVIFFTLYKFKILIHLQDWKVVYCPVHKLQLSYLENGKKKRIQEKFLQRGAEIIIANSSSNQVHALNITAFSCGGSTQSITYMIAPSSDNISIRQLPVSSGSKALHYQIQALLFQMFYFGMNIAQTIT